MSLELDDSPLPSSSSEDFAAIIEAGLETDSEEVSPDTLGSDSEYEAIGLERSKKQKVYKDEEFVDHTSVQSSSGMPSTSSEALTCRHPGFIRKMCIVCGKHEDDASGVALDYIYKGLMLRPEEASRLRKEDLKTVLGKKKLYLILDLDHTLLNSTRLFDLSPEEDYYVMHTYSKSDSSPDDKLVMLSRSTKMLMLTKLRPYVHEFLREASSLFEMYIYTMGERAYALEMAKLLDPGGMYFASKVISQGDSTVRNEKGLDVVLGVESAALIVDDTEQVWKKHKENLILMERYHFFASSCRQFGFGAKSLSELRMDESESEGALASILNVLRRVHELFFQEKLTVDGLAQKDVREVLKSVRREVLKDCNIAFSRLIPKNSADKHPYWKMAEELGATCYSEIDPCITHVITNDLGTDKSRWAMQEKKAIVNIGWLEASNYLWRRQTEDRFPVTSKSHKDKPKLISGQADADKQAPGPESAEPEEQAGKGS